MRQNAQQLDIRVRELNLQEKQFDHQSKYAEKVLAAQAEDLKDQRVHEGKQTNRKMIGAGILVVLILAFLGTCILTGHETVALELVKVAVYGTGGYAIGRSKRSRPADTPDQPE